MKVLASTRAIGGFASCGAVGDAAAGGGGFAVQNPPWAQAAAYHAALRESKNPTALLLIGGGDPTGRGRGFAFTREEVRKGKDEAGAGPGVRAKDDGTITGEQLVYQQHHQLMYQRSRRGRHGKWVMDVERVIGEALACC
jgi:hypothetical protein